MNTTGYRTMAALISLLLLAPPLGAQQPAAQPSGHTAAPDAATAARWRQRWGFYLDMLDTPYITLDDSSGLVDNTYRSVLSWDVPGESMISKVFRADTAEVIASNTLRWNESSRRIDTVGTAPDIVAYRTVQADGSITSSVESTGSVHVRNRTTGRMLADGVVEYTAEQDLGQGWQAPTRSHSGPATEANLAEALQFKAAFEQAKRAADQQVVQGKLARLQRTSSASAADIATYGVLARLAGTAWALAESTSKYGTSRALTRFTWLDGRSGVQVEDSGTGGSWIWKVTPGKNSGELLMDGGIENSEVVSHYVLRKQDESTLVSDWSRRSLGYQSRVVIALLANGNLGFQEEVAERGKLPSLASTIQTLTVLGKEQIDYGSSNGVIAGNQATGKAIIKEVNAQLAAEARERQRIRDERWSKVMGALYTGLTVANEIASAHEAQSRAALDATLAQGARPDGAGRNSNEGNGAGSALGGAYASTPEAISQQPTGRLPAASGNGVAASDAPGKPLRFVLDIGLMNKPGDTVNPTCYSNVITRPGPPGWGGSGFLPEGSYAQARQHVDALKEQFIARCRASGRDITSEGNFHWTWNETRDGDQQVSNAHAQYREDVSVQL